jgi:uncharacterized protein with PQ loop repeat
MFAQIPQLVKNWSRQSSESLSPAFLTCWLLGDATNLFGCLLTQQQAFQVRMAAYFVSMDVVMLTQFGYLYWKNMKSKRRKLLVKDKGTVYPGNRGTDDVAVDFDEDQIHDETAPLLSKSSIR